MALHFLGFNMPTAVAAITIVVLGMCEGSAWGTVAGNDPLRCQTQVPLLDSTTTDRWLRFESWQCNVPPLDAVLDRPLLSYYSEDSCGERILVLSNCTADTCACGLKTWTYRVKTNSWSLVENENRGSQPEYRGSQSSLVTICKSTVLYVTDSQPNESSLWMFDGQTEIWSERSLVGIRPPSEVLSRGVNVLIDHNSTLSTSCECKYAIVGFSYEMDVVWKLACSDAKENYVWKRMEVGHKRSQTAASQMLEPTRFEPSTMCAGTEEGLVLVMSNDGLWKYHLYENLWHHVSSLNLSFFENIKLAFYSSKDKLYVLLSADFRQLKIYSFEFEIKRWTAADRSSITTSFSDLDYRYNIALTTNSSRVFLYSGLGVREGCVQLLWELDGTGNHWQQTEVSFPLLSPLVNRRLIGTTMSVVCSGDKLYVLVSKQSRDSKTKRDLWVLHLISMYWTLVETFDVDYVQYQQSIVLQHSVYLTFDQIRWWNFVITGHDTKNMSWTLYDDSLDGQSIRKRDFSVASVNSSSFLVYIGALGDDNQYFCDLWVVTLTSRQSSSLEWTRLEQSCFIPKEDNLPWPVSQTDYKSVVVNNTFILMAGITLPKCYFDVWHYSLIDNIWTHGFVDDSDLSIRYNCISSVVSAGSQILVGFNPMDTYRYKLWLYAVKTMSWVLHSETVTVTNEEFYPFFWRGILFLYEKDLSSLLYRKLVCPPGYSSPNILQLECIACANGFFSTGVGETSCTSCPQGLTTSSSRSTSSSNCSLCQDDGNYCLRILWKPMSRPQVHSNNNRSYGVHSSNSIWNGALRCLLETKKKPRTFTVASR